MITFEKQHETWNTLDPKDLLKITGQKSGNKHILDTSQDYT